MNEQNHMQDLFLFKSIRQLFKCKIYGDLITNPISCLRKKGINKTAQDICFWFIFRELCLSEVCHLDGTIIIRSFTAYSRQSLLVMAYLEERVCKNLALSPNIFRLCGKLDRKGGALPEFRLHKNLSSEHFTEFFSDREPQPCSSELLAR